MEFANKTAPAVATWMRSLGTGDNLYGGCASNVLIGGQFSATFVFNAADNGTHRVMEIEAWDIPSFLGFGFASANAVRSAATQNGNAVVISDQGTTITLEGLALSGLNDNILAF